MIGSGALYNFKLWIYLPTVYHSILHQNPKDAIGEWQALRYQFLLAFGFLKTSLVQKK